LIQDKIQIIMNPYFICALTENNISLKGKSMPDLGICSIVLLTTYLVIWYV